MNTQSKTKFYMWFIISVGFACLSLAVLNFPLQKLDINFFFLFAFTIGFSSRITIKIPRFKSHIAVSDTFIFLVLLLYGGEVAIVLAAIEAFFSSWRFCNKKITVFFNAGAMALSTTIVVGALSLLGLYTEIQMHGKTGNIGNFFMVLSVMALSQFFSNTTFASIYGTLKSHKPLWETWTSQYIWTFITYFVGAASAGTLIKLSDSIGYGAVVVTFPVIYFVYLTYRMYLKNVEMSITQAEQAKLHASVLEEQSLALSESEARFRSAFNYAPIGIALVGPTGKWLKVNCALRDILGYSEEELLSANFQSMLFAEDLGDTLIIINDLLSGKIPSCQMEQRYLHKNKKTVWASWSASIAGEVNSENPNFIFQIQDITGKRQAEEKLQYEARHDALTGLPNRAFFLSRLEIALQKSITIPDYKISVLFIDLDRFKFVNDSLGHLVGDLLLIGIAKRLRECLRPNDIVARLGGDEFTILVEGFYEPLEVIKIAERLQDKFNLPFNLNGHELYSSASIGILHKSEKHQLPEDLMRDADTAMYQAKRAGKSCHEVFDQNMHEVVKRTLQMETDLRRAIERKELTVYYQPIYSLLTERFEGFEALARWNHKDFGIVSPGKFIPIAEEVGLIDALGELILSTACSQMRSLSDKSTGETSYFLSVNLSCKQFAQPNLVQNIKRLLVRTNFPPDKLKLEITESVFFEHKEKAVGMLHQLRNLGIEINVDDFGTGYSNLSYLMQLPISTLKIDRSFIAPINAQGENMEIVETIIMLARKLGMKVIAEGIENSVQLEQLRKLKCEGAQGFYFSEPMSFEDTRQFIESIKSADISPPPEFENLELLSTIQ